MKTFYALLVCLLLSVSCDDHDDTHSTNCDPSDRIGALFVRMARNLLQLDLALAQVMEASTIGYVNKLTPTL